jgi:hypothetical protein
MAWFKRPPFYCRCLSRLSVALSTLAARFGWYPDGTARCCFRGFAPRSARTDHAGARCGRGGAGL